MFMRSKPAATSYTLVAITLTLLAACAPHLPPNQAHEDSQIKLSSSPTLPYAVGSTTLFIHDESRPFDTDAGVTSGARILLTELWYPVAHDGIEATATPATYGDYVFGNRDVHQLMMTQTTNFHITPETVRSTVNQTQIDAAIAELFDRQRGSYKDALPAKSGSWPVVVVSHGDAGSRYNMQTVSEYLAAHGYLVIAPEHTGNSPFSMVGADPALNPETGDPEFIKLMAEVLPLLDDNGVYGSGEWYGQSYSPLSGDGAAPSSAEIVALDNSLLQRVYDLRAVLRELEAMNRAGKFAGKIDLSKLALIGRSFGGATTLAGLALESRFQAGVAVAPPAVPDLRLAVPPEALVKPPAESVLLSASESTALDQLHKPTLLIVGGEDSLILNVASSMAKAMGTKAPTRGVPYPALYAAFKNSQVPAVFALLPNTNHASLSTAGPYWWPQLKPNKFPRFFQPDEDYQLTNAIKAHQIQREMVLAFLDATIRCDEVGEALLKDNPWSEQGTRLELHGPGPFLCPRNHGTN